MSKIEQLLAILGVGPNSTIDEVKQAYRDLVLVWHPDRFVNNTRLQQKAQERLKEINRAYNILLDSLQGCRQDLPEQELRQSDIGAHQGGVNKAPGLGRYCRIYPALVFALIAMVTILVVMPFIRGDLAEVPYNLGKMHYQSGHYAQALTMYKVALWLNPDNSRIYSGMGEAYYALKRFDDAKNAFLKATRANPADAKAYSSLALSYCQLGILEKSWEACHQVSMIDSNCSEVLYDIGLICEQRGLDAVAEKTYKKAIELNPICEKAYCRLGLIYARNARYDEAASVFRKVIEISPKNAEAQNYLRAALKRLSLDSGELNGYRHASQGSSLQGSYQ